MIETWFTGNCYVCEKIFSRYKSQININNPCCSQSCANKKIIIEKRNESIKISKKTGVYQIKLTRNQFAIVDKDDFKLTPFHADQILERLEVLKK